MADQITFPIPRLTDLGSRVLWEGGLDYEDGFRIRVEWDEEQDPDNPEWRATIEGLPDNIAAGSTFGFGPTKEAALCDLVCALAVLAQALNDPPADSQDPR